MTITTSIIIPCYNEEKNISETIKQLVNVFSEDLEQVEIIAVNDGSRDETWNVLKEIRARYSQLKIINLMSNFGQSAAYQAGIDVSRGDYILFTSADLETDPVHLLTVKKYLTEGYDFVNTNRVNRWIENPEKSKSISLKNLKSQSANWLISSVSGIKINDRGSGTKGMIHQIAKELRFYTDMHRFIPDYAYMYSKRIIEFDVEFQNRQFGESAYAGQSRLLKVLLDIITLGFMLNFAKKPFKASPGRLLGISGLTLFVFGTFSLSYLVIIKLMGVAIGNRPLLIISILLIILGFQAVILGIIGELLMRVYFESSGRKTYLTREEKL